MNIDFSSTNSPCCHLNETFILLSRILNSVKFCLLYLKYWTMHYYNYQKSTSNSKNLLRTGYEHLWTAHASENSWTYEG